MILGRIRIRVCKIFDLDQNYFQILQHCIPYWCQISAKTNRDIMLNLMIREIALVPNSIANLPTNQATCSTLSQLWIGNITTSWVDLVVDIYLAVGICGYI